LTASSVTHPAGESKENEMNIGDYVITPRFCTVRINAIFSKEQEARSCGYTEPTYYEGSDCVILGKSLDVYHMIFAAVPKTPT
jgi:hypothetical protein